MHRKSSINWMTKTVRQALVIIYDIPLLYTTETSCNLNQNHNNNKVIKSINKSYCCAICDWFAHERTTLARTHVCNYVFECILVGNVIWLRLHLRFKSHGMPDPSNKSIEKIITNTKWNDRTIHSKYVQLNLYVS